MKLEIVDLGKRSEHVVCPRIAKAVDPNKICQHCEWLTVSLATCVKCNWSKEREGYKRKRVYYDVLL